jgi:four helix bundle protein
MFLKLSHHKLEVYKHSEELTIECYQVTRLFPPDEKYALVQQVRRAALSVFLNLNEGCSRKSAVERNRFFEMSRGSLIEIDSAIGIACKLNYIVDNDVVRLGELILTSFKMFTNLIYSSTKS